MILVTKNGACEVTTLEKLAAVVAILLRRVFTFLFRIVVGNAALCRLRMSRLACPLVGFYLGMICIMVILLLGSIMGLLVEIIFGVVFSRLRRPRSCGLRA